MACVGWQRFRGLGGPPHGTLPGTTSRSHQCASHDAAASRTLGFALGRKAIAVRASRLFGSPVLAWGLLFTVSRMVCHGSSQRKGRCRRKEAPRPSRGSDEHLLGELLEHFGEQDALPAVLSIEQLRVEIGDVLRASPYAIEELGGGVLSAFAVSVLDGFKVHVILEHETKQLKLLAGFGGLIESDPLLSWTRARTMLFVNTWNTNKRLAKLHTDDNDNLILEMDALPYFLLGTSKTLPSILRYFCSSSIELMQALKDAVDKHAGFPCFKDIVMLSTEAKAYLSQGSGLSLPATSELQAEAIKTFQMLSLQVEAMPTSDQTCAFVFAAAPALPGTLVLDGPGNLLTLKAIVDMRSAYEGRWNRASSALFANKWNTEKKFTVMYVDPDGDLVIRLDAAPALLNRAKRALASLISLFRHSADEMSQSLMRGVEAQT